MNLNFDFELMSTLPILNTSFGSSKSFDLSIPIEDIDKQNKRTKTKYLS